MKKLLILFIGASLLLNSCGFGKAADEAEKYAQEFYKHMQNSDFEAIEPMLDEEALKISPTEEWRSVIVQKDVFGKLEKFEKDLGFHTSINNGTTTVSLRYTCDYSDIRLFEKLVLVKRGDKYKILSYEYNKNKNALSDD